MNLQELDKNQTAPPGGAPDGSLPSAAGGKKRLAARSPASSVAESAANRGRKGTSRSALRAYLFLAVVVTAGLTAWGGYAYLTRNIETTDDAFIDADVVALSPRVGGPVLHVEVGDNQLVKKDQLLVEIDPGPYQARLKQAEAALSIARADSQAAEAEVTITTASAVGGHTVAQAGVSNAEISIAGADAQVLAAAAVLERTEAQVRKAEADLERTRQLAASGALPGVDLEHREREAEVARAQFREAKAQLSLHQEQARVARSRIAETRGRLRQSEPVTALLERAEAQVELARARVKSAEAAVDLARIDLDSTRVVASVPGRITRLAVRPGQMVQPGQLLLYLVPQERYMVANFKETQVGRMKPGQAVEIEIDAYPGRLFQARIESLMTGTGSRFSLLPADNATGNFVKVVQRIPVRIAWQGEPPGVFLAPGMSAFVKVHVGERNGEKQENK